MASSTETDAPSSKSLENSDAHKFYNNPPEDDLNRRNESEIFCMRNFNNWVKSILISTYLQRVKSEQPERRNEIHVFDMGCGKGGDQRKWNIGRVKFVTFADLAEKSLTICEKRYKEGRHCYKAEFFPLNCTTELLRDKIETTEPRYDLVSSQFVLHYSFDKLQSANQFLRNAAEFLRVGGYFIGTTVNSCRLVDICRNSPDQSISNNVCSIVFDSSIDLKQTSNASIPLFGAKYHFRLGKPVDSPEYLVDCPEYLVYFPLLVYLAERHGLELIERQTFEEYFQKHSTIGEGPFLLERMKALDRYELPTDNQRNSSIDHSQFTHAARYLEDNIGHHTNLSRSCRTMSKEEWEIASLYIIFTFKKVKQVEYDETTNTSK